MPSVSAPHWRCIPPDAIAWREWDGEFVVRNERTGNSHLLGLLAGRVLRVLVEADGSLSVDSIAARIGHLQAAEEDTELCAAIDKILSEFHRLEFAMPVRQ